MPDDFLVLGDLTERDLGEYVSPSRKLIVRMFVKAGATFDEEIDVASMDELRPVVEKRMKALRAKPDKTLHADAQKPAEHPGHAIEVPE